MKTPDAAQSATPAKAKRTKKYKRARKPDLAACVQVDDILKKKLLTIRDVATVFSASEKTIERMVEKGKLARPLMPSPRRCLWLRENVLEAIEKLKQEALAAAANDAP